MVLPVTCIYELHYENAEGIFYCGTYYDVVECIREMRALSIEFPHNDYWYDTYEIDEGSDQ